jgi:predicted RNA-binding Zn ribbon-like protein
MTLLVEYHYMRMPPPTFPLQGQGPPCLDLANTLISVRAGRDLLATDEQLTAWVSSLNMDVDPRALGAAGGERLRALRTVIRDVRPLDRRLVAELNAVAAAAPMTSQLGVTKASPRLRTAHAPATPPLDALLGDLARSAIELLAGDERTLLRACPGEGCRLLFVATDPRRVWCSSETCGNRARVARHRAERR